MSARAIGVLTLATAFLFSLEVAAGNLLDNFEKLNIPKPSAALKKVAIGGISLKEIKLRLDTAIDNPYPVGLPKAAMNLDLNIENSKLAKLASSGVQIAAGKATTVPFDVLLNYKDLMAIYQKVKGKEALTLGMNGSLALPIPTKKLKEKGLYFKGMPKELKFPIKADSLLPAVLPKIDLRNFRILQPSQSEIKASAGNALVDVATSFLNNLLTSGGASPGSAAQAGLGAVDLPISTEFQMVLSNSAAAKVLFESLQYDLMLGKEKFLSGQSAKIENKGLESIVTVKSSFPLKGVSTAIASAIKARKADFNLVGTSGMQIPALPGGGQVPFSFDHSGQLKW